MRLAMGNRGTTGKKRTGRLLAVVCLTACLLAGSIVPSPARAATVTTTLMPTNWPDLVSNPLGFEGGIRNEQQYQELVFVTGEPVLVTGELKFSGGRGGTGGTTSQSYTYKLENKEKGIKMTRTIGLVVSNVDQGGQTTQVTTLKSFNESITASVGSNKATYKLAKDGYQFNQSSVFDHRPGVDYFSGGWSSRKVYEINKDQGTLTVDMQGETVGYNHFWGSTETRKISCNLSSYRAQSTAGATGTSEETVEWDGNVNLQVSFNRTKSLNYQETGASGISFAGGYDLLEQEENVLHCSYDLPYFDEDGEEVADWRNQDTQDYKLNSVPRHKRLPVFTMKDIRGHWAQDEITRMVSVGAFDHGLTSFGPSLEISRGDFTRAVAMLTSMQAPVETAPRTAGRRTTAPEVSPFADVPTTYASFPQIKEMVRRGAISGVRQGLFYPEGSLTRAQAVTIVVRVLGLDSLAPNPSYRTRYLDDASIPSWARDSVYVASELGLLEGMGESGASSYRFFPNETLTRAEAAVLLDGLREFMQNDMKKDYRDRLINAG
ncbi:MAG: S-layer homology domain-containing protein [Firmicutes bacterium]|nr:S-layer homology domain-containing protein [Bacillota bacterium]